MTRRTIGTKPTFASLFSGCGGFDLGFTNAGFRCTAAFDIDPLAVGAYRRNLGPHAHVQDLTCRSFDYTCLSGVDVLIAGSPCQGFSTAGRRDVKDPRNSLLVVAGELAVRAKPRVFVAENVIGVLSGPQRRYWERLRHLLSSSGYTLLELICDAADFGVPQTRRRVLLLAWRSSALPTWHLQSIQARKLCHALAKIGSAPNHNPKPLPANTVAGRIARRIKPGQKLCNVRASPRSVPTWALPDVFGPTTRSERLVLEAIRSLRRQHRRRSFGDADPVPLAQLSRHMGYSVASTVAELQDKGYVRKLGRYYDLTHTFNGKYRRLRASEPAPTVDTRFGQPRYFLHPTSHRGFTVREAARIQAFPDTFILDGPDRTQLQLIGNAVPPPVAEQIAAFIRQALLETCQ